MFPTQIIGIGNSFSNFNILINKVPNKNMIENGYNIKDQKDNPENNLTGKSLQELNTLLDEAVANEDYEKAAHLRDEISKR